MDSLSKLRGVVSRGVELAFNPPRDVHSGSIALPSTPLRSAEQEWHFRQSEPTTKDGFLYKAAVQWQQRWGGTWSNWALSVCRCQNELRDLWELDTTLTQLLEVAATENRVVPKVGRDQFPSFVSILDCLLDGAVDAVSEFNRIISNFHRSPDAGHPGFWFSAAAFDDAEHRFTWLADQLDRNWLEMNLSFELGRMRFHRRTDEVASEMLRDSPAIATVEQHGSGTLDEADVRSNGNARLACRADAANNPEMTPSRATISDHAADIVIRMRQRPKELLITMGDKGLFGGETLSQEEIKSAAGYPIENCDRAFNELKDHGLTSSLRGRGGGTQLTPLGCSVYATLKPGAVCAG